jgi:hypothetical protein
MELLKTFLPYSRVSAQKSPEFPRKRLKFPRKCLKFLGHSGILELHRMPKRLSGISVPPYFVVDAGVRFNPASTVIDLTPSQPKLLRRGAGDVSLVGTCRLTL